MLTDWEINPTYHEHLEVKQKAMPHDEDLMVALRTILELTLCTLQ
jgi:hypothetical protein